MRKMGIESRSPKPRTTIPGEPSRIAPYLLKGLQITHPNQVWSTDITYIPMATGFFYLCAVMECFLAADPRLEALEQLGYTLGARRA